MNCSPPIMKYQNKLCMPKSSKRGGEKAHRKRVAKRNQDNKINWQKQVNMAYEKHEEWKKAKAEQPEPQVQINVK